MSDTQQRWDRIPVAAFTARDPSVLLLSMPWGDLQNPPLGPALLKAILNDQGIPCTNQHLNIQLLKYLEPAVYSRFADLYAVNDFLFTAGLQPGPVQPDQLAAFESLVTSDHDRIDMLGRRDVDPQPYIDYALAIREKIIPAFLQDCLALVGQSGATMVGFTCLFDQTIPSVALANLIKQAYPEIMVVLGGYALEGPVGSQMIECFECIDVVALGEGEDKIAALAQASVDRSRLSQIPGILYRNSSTGVTTSGGAASRANLDANPPPDFSDWFADLGQLAQQQDIRIETEFLPLESSRGCWWGQKSHCIFCGIDDDTMRYRAKCADQVLAEIDQLQKVHGDYTLRFSDYILPQQYYQSLLPKLAHRDDDLRLHWEIKSNVKYDDVLTLRRAGVLGVQPGIESFSTPVLKRMRKGVTGIQNVFAIRAMMENYIDVYFNILYGFPGDDPEDYRAMTRQLPSLYHFPPPGTFVAVLTTRFSPMTEHPEQFDITQPLQAEHRYHILFSKAYRDEIGFDLNNYCYIFQRPYDLDASLEEPLGIFNYQLRHWLELWTKRPVRLAWLELADGVRFIDSRFRETPEVHEFGREHQLVHNQLRRKVRTRKELHAAFTGKLDTNRVDRALNDLLGQRLLFAEGERFVALAVPQAVYDWSDQDGTEAQAS